jgi:hypothetical protein
LKYFTILLHLIKYLNDVIYQILISQGRFIKIAFFYNITLSCPVMGTDVSENPTAANFRVEEKYMEPAGSSELLVPKQQTTVRYIPEANIKQQK